MAQSFGIQTDMSILTAQSLTALLKVVTRAPQQEQQHLEELALTLYQFTPTIVIQKNRQQILLEISRCLKLFNNLGQLISKITGKITELGYQHQLGLALTPLAAECISPWYQTFTDNRDFTDHLDSNDNQKSTHNENSSEGLDFKGEQGSTKKISTTDRSDSKAMTRSGCSTTAPDLFDIAALPIRFLPINKKTIEQIHGFGIHTCQALLALPKPEIVRRFGAAFIKLLEQLTGERNDSRVYFSPPDFFKSDHHFSLDVKRSTGLLFSIKQLLKSLEQFLNLRQCSSLYIDINLYQHRQSQQIPIRLSHAEL